MDLNSEIKVIIGALVAVVIGLAFLPTIFSSVNTVATNASYKAAYPSTMSIVTLLPLHFAIVILIVVVGFKVWKMHE